MAKTILPLTDAQMAQVDRATAARDRTEPRVDAVSYDASTQRLTLELRGGAVLTFAARTLPFLADYTDAQLADVRPMENGGSVWWDSRDDQVSTIALLSLVFGIRTATDSARHAASVKTPARAAAARANGAKGGRPRKTPDTEKVLA